MTPTHCSPVDCKTTSTSFSSLLLAPSVRPVTCKGLNSYGLMNGWKSHRKKVKARRTYPQVRSSPSYFQFREQKSTFPTVLQLPSALPNFPPRLLSHRRQSLLSPCGSRSEIFSQYWLLWLVVVVVVVLNKLPMWAIK